MSSAMRIPLTLFVAAGAFWGSLMPVTGFHLDPQPSTTTISSSATSRSDFIRGTAAVAAGWMTAAASSTIKPVFASNLQDKLTSISDEELKQIVKKDVVENQFLCNGQLTRAIYDEGAKFTDEIDTYAMDQWIKGTQKLFVGENSQVRLVGDLDVTKEEVAFRFDEDLQFRIPFRPTVALTGKVVLKRDPNTGLITSYQEFWDQDVATVLKSAKLNFKL